MDKLHWDSLIMSFSWGVLLAQAEIQIHPFIACRDDEMSRPYMGTNVGVEKIMTTPESKLDLRDRSHSFY
jgi:hypothetical protein